jgi:hypothetical protein
MLQDTTKGFYIVVTLRCLMAREWYGTVPTFVADPDPGSDAILALGSEINTPDHISVSLETILWVKNT